MTTSITSPTHDVLERCRRSVLGYLSPLFLHEMNNVLTVMSGIRQLMKAGMQLSDRVGPMIDAQLDKVEQLMEQIRALTPDDPSAAVGRDPGEAGLEAVCRLLELAGKGRPLRIGLEAPAPGELPAEAVEPLALALLGAVLPTLPAHGGDVHEIQLRAGGEGGERWLLAVLDGGKEILARHADVGLSRSLLECYGGRLETEMPEEARPSVRAVLLTG